jgi:pyruvate/2-oxoglutarate dehydrogenase complex dihydrolipoamide dehydrogenase (E3) component
VWTDLGGRYLHTSTIPSKTLREAVLYFPGHRLHSVYDSSYRLKDRITMDHLTFRVQHVIRLELDTLATQMRRSNIVAQASAHQERLVAVAVGCTAGGASGARATVSPSNGPPDTGGREYPRSAWGHR